MKANITRILSPLKAFLELLLGISAKCGVVNPYTSWEELFLKTMKVILAKFGRSGHSGDEWMWSKRHSALIISYYLIGHFQCLRHFTFTALL